MPRYCTQFVYRQRRVHNNCGYYYVMVVQLWWLYCSERWKQYNWWRYIMDPSIRPSQVFRRRKLMATYYLFPDWRTCVLTPTWKSESRLHGCKSSPSGSHHSPTDADRLSAVQDKKHTIPPFLWEPDPSISHIRNAKNHTSFRQSSGLPGHYEALRPLIATQLTDWSGQSYVQKPHCGGSSIREDSITKYQLPRTSLQSHPNHWQE